MLPGSGGEFRRLLPELEKTSFPSYFPLERPYIPSKVAPHSSAPKQKSTWHGIGHGCFFAFYPASIPLSRALHRFFPGPFPYLGHFAHTELRRCIDRHPRHSFFIGRAPSLFDSWTLTARQFFSQRNLKNPWNRETRGFSYIQFSKALNVCRDSFEKSTQVQKISPTLMFKNDDTQQGCKTCALHCTERYELRIFKRKRGYC